VRRLAFTVERDDEREADGHFRRRDGDDEEDQNLAVQVVVEPRNETSARLAALSISSSDIYITSKLRRVTMPSSPDKIAGH